MPFPVAHPGVHVKYVDRWAPNENAELFPELGPEAPFAKPDIIANLDSDRLCAFEDDSIDFAIASHVLEHLADPIGLLAEIHRVIHPGGILLIVLPDRHLTFDRHRPPTPIEHLVAEHRSGVTEVDDAHIEEFISATASPDGPTPANLPHDPIERQQLIQLHRRRSVHAHCWDQGEFAVVLRYSIDPLDQHWEFVDAKLTEEGGPESIEFGFVVRKSIATLPATVFADRFESAWNHWREEQTKAVAQMTQVDALLDQKHRIDLQLAEDGDRLERLNQELSTVRSELESTRQSKSFRYAQLGHRMYTRLFR